MKKLFYSIALIAVVFFALPSTAQISIQINVGSQPQWGPSGYDYARYYYMPEYDMYYDVLHERYVYWDYNRWVQQPVLPARYHHLDLYRTYKVVVNDVHPWTQHQYYRNKYYSYASNRQQINIHDYRQRQGKVYASKNQPSRAVGTTIRAGANQKAQTAKVASTTRPVQSSRR